MLTASQVAESLRLSFGAASTEDELDRAVALLGRAANRLRGVAQAVGAR